MKLKLIINLKDSIYMTHIVYFSLYQIFVTSVNKKIMVNDNTIEKSEKRHILCLNLYMIFSTKAYSMTNPQEISFVLVCVLIEIL